MAEEGKKEIQETVKKLYSTKPLDALIDIVFDQMDRFSAVSEKPQEEAEEFKSSGAGNFVLYHTSSLYNKIGMGHRAITATVGYGLQKFNEGAIQLKVPYILAGASLIPVLFLPKEVLIHLLKSTGAVLGIGAITSVVVLIASAAQKKETAELPPPYKWVSFIAHSVARSIIFVGINNNLKKMFDDFLKESIPNTIARNLLVAIFAAIIAGIMVKLVVALEAQVVPEQAFVILEGKAFKQETFEMSIMADSLGSVVEQTLNAFVPEPLGLMLSSYYKMITSENAMSKGLRDYTKSFLSTFLTIQINKGLRELISIIGEQIEKLPEHLETLRSMLPSLEEVKEYMDKAIISIKEVFHAIAALISSIIEGKEHKV